MSDFMSDDTKLNLSPVCPYCGHEQSDAWELHMSDGEEQQISCDSCDGEFIVTCSISITYSTAPVLGDRLEANIVDVHIEQSM